MHTYILFLWKRVLIYRHSDTCRDNTTLRTIDSQQQQKNTVPIVKHEKSSFELLTLF